MPDPDSSDLTRLFEAQRRAAAADPFPDWPARKSRLLRLAGLVREHEQEIAQAIDDDFGGRPWIETELAEVFPSLSMLRDARRQGARWMRPRRARVGTWFLPASARMVPQPLGVVGIIVPWNYPLVLAIGPLAAALAAGNRALLKLSEYTPTYSALMARLIAERFAPDELAVVQGGPDVAAQFSALPWDHLLFTGSTAVGRKVMAAAAANLTPVTLELGGKSPAVVTPGYPLAHAAERIAVGKLLNAGQTCIAPDYVLVPRPAIDAFVAELQAVARRAYPEGLDSAHYCSIVTTRQFERLAALLAQARDAGLPVTPLFEGPAQDASRHRLAPHAIVDPEARSAAMEDEIFGPLLPLVPYDDLDEALAFINARPRPLALYWFDRQRARADDALRRTHAGGVTVNDALLHITQDSLPFGGVGDSGMGHYHGEHGFATFSKIKPVFHQSRINGMTLFLPPYSPLMRRLLSWMKRG